jgi:GR25 family glycosyltransferase involved in LPS biosynthesis
MYKTYIISLITTGHGDHQLSAEIMLPRTMNFCNQYNWNAEIFHAVNGYNLQKSDWENFGFPPPIKSDKGKEKFGDLPGAQGCFLSHYLLWNRCIELNHPIVVLEDDAEIIAPLEEINIDLDLVKLHKPRASGQSKLGHWSTGAFAYWISPAGAKKLVEFAKQNGPMLADKIIVSSVLDWGYLTPPIVKLGPRTGSSTQPIKYPYKNLY